MAKASSGSTLLASRGRSQSDSDLLASKPDQNGVLIQSTLHRNASMEDVSHSKKHKTFLFRLVRPWKWRKRKKDKKRDSGKFSCWLTVVVKGLVVQREYG